MSEYTVTYEVHIRTKVEADMSVAPEVTAAADGLVTRIRRALASQGLEDYDFEVLSVTPTTNSATDENRGSE